MRVPRRARSRQVPARGAPGRRNQKVWAAHRRLLESRYDLTPKLDRWRRCRAASPLPVGPTARLKQGLNWERPAAMTPAQIREQNAFPYPTLPHPRHVAGGQVFPQIQIDMFPRLQRFDVDFDLPDAFIPEFPPAIFLQNRPELGDVSRGEVVATPPRSSTSIPTTARNTAASASTRPIVRDHAVR
jgi:hypothetical protein